MGSVAHIIDNDNSQGDPVSVASWSLVLTTAAPATIPTTTSLTSSQPIVLTSGAAAFTAMVMAGGDLDVAPTGTVTFTANGSPICANQLLTLAGAAYCGALLRSEGVYTIEATYNPAVNSGFEASTGQSINILARNPSTLSSGQYCNPGAISSTGSTPTVYPSIINVGTDTTALSGTVANVAITLNGLSASNGLAAGQAFLLVAPDTSTAYNLDFLSNAGVSSSQPSANVTIADDNASAPLVGPLLTNTYQATDYATSADPFPQSTSPAPQVPGTINFAQPHLFGISGDALTLEQAFGGANGNGNWSLFLYNASGSPVSVSGGWCMEFTVNNGSVTTTSLTPSSNPVATGTSLTLTASVTSGGNPVTSGTVTFTENGVAPAGVSPNVVALNGSGQASVTTSSLAEGDHNITATYSGVSDLYDPSFTSYWQRVDTTSAVTGGGAALNTNPVQFCNPGGITLPALSGPATPNPSNIFVSGVPGTVHDITLELQNFFTGAATVIQGTASLLVGGSVGLDFFTGTGGSNTVLSTGNYFFRDGAGMVPSGAYGPGNYAPTSYPCANSLCANTYVQSPSGFETLPASFTYAAPAGSGTFTDLFGGGSNPNTTWSLYFNQNVNEATTDGGASAWCVQFTENPPDISVSSESAPTSFMEGGTGAFDFTITNNGPGSSGGSLTLVDTLPMGLSYTGSPPSAWRCSASGQTVTCTIGGSNAVVAADNTYPALSIAVSIASNAPSSVQNSASISGSMDTCNTACTSQETVTITPAPDLTITKTAIGTFTQGSTAEWDIVVGNANAGSTTSGTTYITDQLPSTYTLNSYASTSNVWTCSSMMRLVNCTTTQQVAGGSSFNTLQLFVNVPANSAISVTNRADTYGGGDPAHYQPGDSVETTSTVSLIQVPAAVTINNGGGTQSAPVSSAFGIPLSVTVTDANNVAIQNGNVTFTANPGSNGQSGTFSNSTGTIIVPTGSNGVATAPFSANTKPGSYTVTATAGTASATFNLTNNAGAAANITVLAGGNSQQTIIRTAFPINLEALITDQYGNPVPNTGVTFTAPATGVSGTFQQSGTNSTTVPTNGSGVATASTFTANGVIGPYYVTITSGTASTTTILVNVTAVTSLSLTEATATQITGLNASVTATATNASSAPVANAPILFKVLSGPNAGLSIYRITNASGQATLIYQGTGGTGTDVIQASANGTEVLSGTVSIAWKIEPMVTWANPGPISFGTLLSATQLNASTTVPGTFTYQPPVGTLIGAGTDTLNVTFTPYDTTTYSNGGAMVSIQVSQARPVVTWTPAMLTPGTGLGAAQLDATANVNGSFVYTPAAGAMLSPGQHRLSAVFTPTDTRDFETITVYAIVEVEGTP